MSYYSPGQFGCRFSGQIEGKGGREIKVGVCLIYEEDGHSKICATLRIGVHRTKETRVYKSVDIL